MATVNPLPVEKAASQLRPVYEDLTKKIGKMPNIFAAMAHRPSMLEKFLPLYQAIWQDGTVENHYKELAYLKASMLNGCEYCSRAHMASGKGAGISEEQIRALQFYERSSLFDEKEKATLLYAEQVTRAASTIRESMLQAMRKFYDEGQIVELTMLICMANFTNRFNDATKVIPDLGV
ncbi:MAG: carboxymuconolactone decarboxylase family protein [Candidatus Acidiferrales bacterium]